MQTRALTVAAVFGLLLTASTELAAIAGEAVTTCDAVAGGQLVYKKECARCHGVAGQGSGAASAE